MTYAGARGNTEVQMAQAIHFLLHQEQLHPAIALLQEKLSDIEKKGHVQLKVANSIWPHVEYPLLKDYLALVKQYYDVEIFTVSYEDSETARHTINAWVEKKTEYKIRELVASGILNSLTRLILVNAIYLKGNWVSQFDKRLTRNAPFWVTPAEQVQTPMMKKVDEFSYGESDDLQILELPYAGYELSMIVLLPRNVDGLRELEERLTAENLPKWTNILEPMDVEVLLPRFKITFPFRLDEMLKSMGMEDAFDSDGADFSGMDGTKFLYIGAVLHKAYVSVNEKGTEAAAATAVEMSFGGFSPSPPSFRADHPFIFLIRENSTGSILFLGRVVNPV
jgi:serpin B